MNTAVPGKPRFLVEWYRPDVGGESFDKSLARLIECAETTAAAGAPVHILVTFAVPADEVAFAVFDAESPRAVAELCDRAGIPALRLTPAVGAQFPSSG
jgi:hypothetical protein